MVFQKNLLHQTFRKTIPLAYTDWIKNFLESLKMNAVDKLLKSFMV